MGCGQRVHRQESERRLAVHQDDVVVLHDRTEGAEQRLLAGHLIDELHLSSGQIDVARQQVHAGDIGFQHHVVDGDVAVHQQVVDGAVELQRVDPETDRQRALRVEVDEQHPSPLLGQRRAQVDRGGGLPHAAFLVAHGDDPCRTVALQGGWLRQVRQRTSRRPRLPDHGGNFCRHAHKCTYLSRD